MLASPIAAQGFKPVPWKDRQIPQFVGRVQLAELPLRHACNALKPACRPPVEEALRFLGPERPDHRTRRYNVMRYMSSGIDAAQVMGCELSYAKEFGWEAGIRTPITRFRAARSDSGGVGRSRDLPVVLSSFAIVVRRRPVASDGFVCRVSRFFQDFGCACGRFPAIIGPVCLAAGRLLRTARALSDNTWPRQTALMLSSHARGPLDAGRCVPGGATIGRIRAVSARLPLASQRNPRYRTRWAPPPSPDTGLRSPAARQVNVTPAIGRAGRPLRAQTQEVRHAIWPFDRRGLRFPIRNRWRPARDGTYNIRP